MAVRSLAIAASVFLGACAQEGLPNVRAEWGTTLDSLGVRPVYPMRENLFPGDILLVVPSRCAAQGLSPFSETAFLGSIPPSLLRERVASFYGARPEFAPTSNSQRNSLPTANAPSAPSSGTSGPPVLGLAAQPTLQNVDTVFAADSAPRLLQRGRIAAFPAVILASFSRAQLGVTAATGSGFSRLLGLGSETEERIAIAVSQVEELQLPAPVMVDLISAYLGSAEGRGTLNPDHIEIIRGVLLQQVRHRDTCHNPIEPRTNIVFISRVFYARAIEFELGDRAIGALETAATLQREQHQRRTQTHQVPANTGSSPSTLESDVNNLAVTLTALAGTGSPGISGNIALGRTGSIVLRQAFDRPLAFGADQTFEFSMASVWRSQLNSLFPQQQAAQERGAMWQATETFTSSTNSAESPKSCEDRYEGNQSAIQLCNAIEREEQRRPAEPGPGTLRIPRSDTANSGPGARGTLSPR